MSVAEFNATASNWMANDRFRDISTAYRSLVPKRLVCDYSTFTGMDKFMASINKIDPFDVQALEKSLNDSATRVSAIWTTFLIFSLYLLTAAATVTHRQLFLAEPVKLPVLNIDLPLWGFFFLTPILFLILHIYVLLQVLLLARTAATYNEAIDSAVRFPASNAAVRQRLANTLFAQIFAGSPRERDGWLGRLLRAMATITLWGTPLVILFAFQVAFLPYHSHFVTWTHRFSILLDLVVIGWLWPLILDSSRNYEHLRIRRVTRLLIHFRMLGRPKWRRFAARKILIGISVLAPAIFVFFVAMLFSFPGEPHANLLSGQYPSSIQCERQWRLNDRLRLPNLDVVEQEKLTKFAQATFTQHLLEGERERTKSFQERNFDCSDLGSADLRGTDLKESTFVGAKLAYASLQRANLFRTQFSGANFKRAKLQGASFLAAQMQGAILDDAELQGASLMRASLEGASLERAKLQGANLRFAQLNGASLNSAQLDGAILDRAQLQGASLNGASLRGVSLNRAQLQGANLNEALMTHSNLVEAFVWRARNVACVNARVSKPNSKPVMERELKVGVPFVPEPLDTHDNVLKFIERSVEKIPAGGLRENASRRMHSGLTNFSNDDTAESAKRWQNCEELSAPIPIQEFNRERALFLRKSICNARDGHNSMAAGIIGSILSASIRSDFSIQIAGILLGDDGYTCPTTRKLEEQIKESLRSFVTAANDVKPITPLLLPIPVTPP